MSNEKFVRERATRRIEAIKYSMARIEAKMKTADVSKLKAYQKRLDEYAISLKALDLEMLTGKPMRIGGQSSPGETVVSVPAGQIKARGN